MKSVVIVARRLTRFLLAVLLVASRPVLLESTHAYSGGAVALHSPDPFRNNTLRSPIFIFRSLLIWMVEHG